MIEKQVIEIDDDTLRRVAYAIFKAESDFAILDDEPTPLPERHFKVAIVLYLAKARAAIETYQAITAET